MEQPRTAEDILSAYRPSSEPIKIALPDGGYMTFKPIVSSEDRRRLVDQVAKFMNAFPERGTTAFSAHPFKELWPQSVEDQSLSLILHFRAIDPPIPLALAFQYHQAPELIAYLESRLASADKEMAALMRDRILEDARKKSQTLASEGDLEPVSEGSQDENPTT